MTRLRPWRRHHRDERLGTCRSVLHRHERERRAARLPGARVTIVIDLTPALIGMGTILTASTLVWMISVRLEDASIADICWGLGFVLLACCMPPVADADTAVLAGCCADHAVGRAPLLAHFPPQSWQRGGPALPGDARLAWAGLLVAESLHGLLVAGRDPGSSPFRSLSRCAPVHRPPSPPSTAWEFCSSRSGSASRSWVTINSSASGASLPIAERCSTVGCGATRGIPITSETRRCGGASMPSRPQRPADGSPC